jgi:hypothetical protein
VDSFAGVNNPPVRIGRGDLCCAKNTPPQVFTPSRTAWAASARANSSSSSVKTRASGGRLGSADVDHHGFEAQHHVEDR